MSKLFWGFFLIFINFQVTLNGHVVDLLPAFVGYILLCQGMAELAGESPEFERGRPFALAMGVYSAILWGMDLLGLSVVLGGIGLLLGLVGMVLSLCVSYLVVNAIQDMERRRGADLNGGKLRSIWLVLAVVQVIAYVGRILPMLGLVCVLIGLVGIILFLVNLRRAQRRYEALPPQLAGAEGFTPEGPEC